VDQVTIPVDPKFRIVIVGRNPSVDENPPAAEQIIIVSHLRGSFPNGDVKKG
jgi:hypothetical protein